MATSKSAATPAKSQTTQASKTNSASNTKAIEEQFRADTEPQEIDDDFAEERAKADKAKAEKDAQLHKGDASYIDVSREAASNTNPPSVEAAKKDRVSSIPHSSGSYAVTETDKDGNITKQYLSSEKKG